MSYIMCPIAENSKTDFKQTTKCFVRYDFMAFQEQYFISTHLHSIQSINKTIFRLFLAKFIQFHHRLYEEQQKSKGTKGTEKNVHFSRIIVCDC